MLPTVLRSGGSTEIVFITVVSIVSAHVQESGLRHGTIHGIVGANVRPCVLMRNGISRILCAAQKCIGKERTIELRIEMHVTIVLAQFCNICCVVTKEIADQSVTVANLSAVCDHQARTTVANIGISHKMHNVSAPVFHARPIIVFKSISGHGGGIE